MRTVAETPEFQKQAAAIWSEDERLAFILWLAAHPDAGDVVPGSGGVRKIRWQRAGMGKRGGVRVVYCHFVKQELVLLLAIYTKSERENMLATDLKRLTK